MPAFSFSMVKAGNSVQIQGVPKRCIHSLNRYNLIKLLIFAFK